MWVEIEHGDRRRRIYCREAGQGEVTMLHLHGGWGYTIYPIDHQVEALSAQCRIVIPDRLGYGRSGRRHDPLPPDFHQHAAQESLAVMDALGLERAILWGHSDGACIAAWMGLMSPQRCAGLVLEALHFERAKPRSREFFSTMETDPESFGGRLSRILAEEHGEDSWRDLMRLGGAAWREIRETPHPHADLFDGRLAELESPVLLLHGARDPRTEPGELEAVLEALPETELHKVAAGRHCPHAEAGVQGEATAALSRFLLRHGLIDEG